MKLQKYREETMKVSRSEFADMIGVGRNAIYRYENGDIPSKEIIKKIYKRTRGKVSANDFHEQK